MATTNTAWLERADGARTEINESCSLGRSSAGQVVIDSPKASRKHAIISRESEHSFLLVDLGSVNGTYLNGRRVVQPMLLQDGDSISIADVLFTFREAQPSVRPRTPDLTNTEGTVLEVRTVPCWLLVADLQGFTEMSCRIDAEEVPKVTSPWLQRCRKLVEAHHGSINKFLGDGFFAYWKHSETADVEVCNTFIALKKAQEEEGPAFRFVAHYGIVVISGGGLAAEENLTGREVNFVFRMEKLAGTIGVTRLLSEAAAQRLPSLHATMASKQSLAGFPDEYVFYTF